MTLPLSTVTASVAYTAIQDAGINLSSYIRLVQAGITAGSVPSQDLLATLGSAVALLAQAQALVANAPLAASVETLIQQQANDPTLDVVGEFAASMTALAALISAIQTDFPKDSSGYLMDRIFSTTGGVSSVAFAPSLLPTVPAALAVWLATVS
jgi:hypothetical protein